MPQLLQGVICVIETFKKYARKEGDCWTLSSEQLKQLLLGEIGEFLKPFDILTAGTNSNLLDRDGDNSIDFNEFLLLVFDMMDMVYQDIQSFLNLEPKAESNTEEESSRDVESCETREHYQEEAGLGQYEQRLTGTESPSLVNPIEKVPDTLTKEDPQDDLETPRLLGREVEHNHPKSQFQGEGDEQSPERMQVQATGGDQVPPEEKRSPKEFVKRACSQKEEKSINEGNEVSREQGGTNTRDQPAEQEEQQNMEIQSVHTEETAQKASESQEKTLIKEAGEHTETQKPSSQENRERESETTDLSTERVEEKLSETKRLAECRGDDGTADNQEPPVQREYETQDILAKTEVLVDEGKGKRKPENSETVGQKINKEDNQMETLTEQEPDGKEKQLEGLAGDRDIRKDSVTPDLKSGDDQNHPVHKGPAASEEEVTVSEISEPEFSGDNRSASVAERTPETKDRVQGSGPQDNQSGGKYGRVTQTLDQPSERYDGHKVENQNDGTLSETYNNHGDDESGSAPRDLPAQSNCRRQVDAQEQPDQEDGKNPQESSILDDKSRTPKTEVPIDREHNENTTEELEQLTEEKKKKSSVAKTPATLEESESQQGAQESMKQKVTATSPKTEITDPADDNEDGQLSIVQESEGKDQGKDPEAHGPDEKEEREDSESQEAPLEGRDPETQDLTLDSSPDTLNPVKREDNSPQRLAGEGREQRVANKEDDSSSGLSEQVERKARDTEPCSSSGDEVHSNPVYENVQMTPAQPDLPAPEERPSQTDTTQAFGPELRIEREPQRSKTSEHPAPLDPLCGYRQEPRLQVGDPEPDEEYDSQQETLASQSREDGQPRQDQQ
ncbi:trichohyalin-like protein 1 [Vombatus ursinus]|uniref:EF-hand domain-containing protein n=1 Tax=Vombatus ursinus TaxID=29139 RepID=A0A4X2LKR0_VOMUR|nr:trichohyalin-like protein 1 [Vombatus ursinus]XP_027717403.1 trichohyalin-like protein 1 [Vombatus ursinus]